MIKEAIEYVFGLGNAGEKPAITELPRQQIMITYQGEKTILDKDPEERRPIVADMASLFSWLEMFLDGTVEIQVSKHGVYAAVDFEDPGVRLCTVPLDYSPAYKVLETWINNPAIQRQVVKGLRGPLYGTCSPGILPIFRNIDFQRNKQAKAALAHARESLGKSVESMAQSSAGEIPEELSFEVRAYAIDVPIVPTSLRFALDVDHEAEKFAISPIADTWETFARDERRQIADWIKTQLPDANVTVGI